MNLQKIVYWTSTGMLTLLMLFSAYNYFFKYPMIEGFFVALGYPTYLIYPLAIAKILGLLAIWTRKSNLLKEWAYAGFFYDTVLAFTAHYFVDGGILFAAIGIILVLVSRLTEGLVFGNQ